MSEEGGFKYREFAVTIGYQVLFTVAMHPLEFAEFLLQIGHAPIPGYPLKTYIGLRNTIMYMIHIRNTDGCLGCYRGVLARIRTRIAGSSALTAITYNLPTIRQQENPENNLSFSRFVTMLWKDIVGVTITMVVTQPFIVISWRVMGQFVGRETIYSSFFYSIGEVYSRSGITGFFTGLVPRWLGEVFTQIMTHTICYAINCYLIDDPIQRAIIRILVRYLCYIFNYPLIVTAVCYGVNNSGLECGEPPNMPYFSGWTDAFRFVTRSSKKSKLKQ